MIVGLIGSSFVDYANQLLLFTGVMVAVNGVCALQDVAIDALAVSSLRPEERGLGNGLMFAGAYIGQALGGSGMLFLAGRMGSIQPAFYVVAGMVGVVWGATLLFMREPPETSHTLESHSPTRVFWSIVAYVADLIGAVFGTRPQSVRSIPLILLSNLGRPGVLAFLLALLPASAMALGLALQAALAVEVGLSDDQIATMGLLGAISAAAGSVLGGWISDRAGHRRSLAVYVLLTLVPTAALAVVMQQQGWILPVEAGADGAPTAPPILVDTFFYGVVVYGFFSGLTYGTRMAIFMMVCDAKVAATQFTAYMAASNLAISYSAAWQGSLVVAVGYPTTLAVDCAAGLACLAVLPFLRPTAPPATQAPTSAAV